MDFPLRIGRYDTQYFQGQIASVDIYSNVYFSASNDVITHRKHVDGLCLNEFITGEVFQIF